MVIMGMGDKEIIQGSALQGVFNILYCNIRTMSHAAVKQGGILFADKKIALAGLVRDTVYVPFH